MPPPDSLSEKITHQDPSLKATVTSTGGMQGDMTYDVSYTTDGKECVNHLGENEFKSTVHLGRRRTGGEHERILWGERFHLQRPLDALKRREDALCRAAPVQRHGRSRHQDGVQKINNRRFRCAKFYIENLFRALMTLACGWSRHKRSPTIAVPGKRIPAKSDFGPLPPPDTMVEKIAHEDPSLKVNVAQTGGSRGRDL